MLNIPTEKEYLETREKYKPIFRLDFWLKPEADSKQDRHIKVCSRQMKLQSS